MAKSVRKNSRIRSIGLALGAILLLGGVVFAGAQLGNRPIVAADTPTGDVKSVIVKFKYAEAVSSSAAADRQQATIEKEAQKVSEAVPYSTGYKLMTRSYDNLPYAVYTVDAEGEASLKADPNVEVVFDNEILESLADLPIPTIGGSSTGNYLDGADVYNGDGYAVAVIDTGVDSGHPALAGKVIAEACFGENETYSNADVVSLCPGAVEFSSATGSGQDCTLDGCGHGTSVAAAAAMDPVAVDIDADSTPDTLVGSARGAKVVAIQVAVQITSATVCPTSPGNVCAKPLSSLYLAALDYVATLSTSVPIASANLSIGSSTDFATDAQECSAFPTVQAYSAAATALRAHNIAPIVANGNSGDPTEHPTFVNKLGAPACAQGAIAVGATNVLGTAMASYSNNSVATALLAPGGDWDGTNSDSLLWLPLNATTSFSGTQGTSFAAPIAAGAFAVLREKHPQASVDSLLTLLQTSGTNVTDARAGYTVGAKKLIDVAAALVQSPYPSITSFSGPAGTVNEGAAITLTGAVANATSCSLNNGVGNVSIAGGVISVSVPGAASYTLTCTNAYGDIDTSVESFTINAAPTTPEVVEQSYNNDAQTFTISWNASTDADGVAEYRVYLNGQLVATLPAGTTSYTFDNILSGTAYNVEVRAVDLLGAISSAATLDFGGANGSEEVLGVPNTGALSLMQSAEMRILLVSGLGILAVITLVVAVKKRSTR